LLLQQMLERGPHFQSSFRDKNSGSSSCKPVRIHGGRRHERRKIDGVIDVELRTRLEATANHHASTGVAGPDADGQGQRVGLQIADPYGVEAFVIDSEGRKKTAHADRRVLIRNEVNLRVIYLLLDLPMESAAARQLHHVRFEVCPGFKKPALSHGHQHHRSRNRGQVRVAPVEVGNKPGASLEYRYGLHITGLTLGLTQCVQGKEQYCSRCARQFSKTGLAKRQHATSSGWFNLGCQYFLVKAVLDSPHPQSNTLSRCFLIPSQWILGLPGNPASAVALQRIAYSLLFRLMLFFLGP